MRKELELIQSKLKHAALCLVLAIFLISFWMGIKYAYENEVLNPVKYQKVEVTGE
jgi:hypothetical protein